MINFTGLSAQGSGFIKQGTVYRAQLGMYQYESGSSVSDISTAH